MEKEKNEKGQHRMLVVTHTMKSS